MESYAQRFACLDEEGKKAFFEALLPEQLEQLRYTWEFYARAKQRTPPGAWSTWLLLAGRGFGKTRTGAEFIRAHAESTPNARIALVGRTAADVRDVMVRGESGLLNVCPPWNRPEYVPSTRSLLWKNGAMATTYSAKEPDVLRGPQHTCFWGDELAAWMYPEAWDNLQLGLRLGSNPRGIATTTPLPTDLIKELAKEETTHLTTGGTNENKDNLPKRFLDRIYEKYAGTRLGRQELDGEILDDVEGALWTHDMIQRVDESQLPQFERVVVAVDPAVTNNKKSDETGIVCAAVGVDNRYYVLGDYSIKASADTWARRSISVYDEHDADKVIGEVNNGGDLVESLIRTIRPNVNYKAVRASRGKEARAEPVSALYEQRKVSHVGIFKELEDQMTGYVQGVSRKSPDRMDALVWALSELALKKTSVITEISLFGGTKESWRDLI